MIVLALLALVIIVFNVMMSDIEFDYKEGVPHENYPFY